MSIAEVVDALAGEKGVSSSQIALAWVHAQGDDIVPIPGTKRRSYLEQNVRALDVVLGDGDLARLNAAGSAQRRPLPRHVARQPLITTS